MFIPSSPLTALALMTVTMCCWGSWANTKKMSVKWPFELFYWDFASGVLFTSIIFSLILGHFWNVENSFISNLLNTNGHNILLAIGSGALFNVSNVLLVAAIALLGIAVAFPIAVGIALIEGTLLSFYLEPRGNFLLIVAGLVLIIIAISCNARAYQLIKKNDNKRKPSSNIAIFSGLLMGLFYPILSAARQGVGGLDPYSANIVFSIGLFLSNIPINMFLMRYPQQQKQSFSLLDYLNGSLYQHFIGWFGGAIWSIGLGLNLIAAISAGGAISFAMAQGATMIAAIWGVFIWREFKNAEGASRWLFVMFSSYIAGLCVISMAQS